MLVCYGPMVRTCLDAAAAAEEDGLDLEVIDLRTLSPLDLDPVFDVGAAHRPAGGRVRGAVVGRRSRRRSPPGCSEECFYSLAAPVLRVTGFDTPYPPSRCEDDYLPDLDRVLDAVDRGGGRGERRDDGRSSGCRTSARG